MQNNVYESRSQINYFSLFILYIASSFITAIIIAVAASVSEEFATSVSIPAMVIGQIICIFIFVKIDILSIRSSLNSFNEDLKKSLSTCAVLFIAILIFTLSATPVMNDLILAIGKLFDADTVLPETSENQSAIVSMLKSANIVSVISIVIMVTIVAPIFEELIFRKALISSIDRVTSIKWVGYVVSVIIFALIHVALAGDLLSVGPYLVTGAGFTAIYWYKQNNIIYPIIIHMMWNIMVTIIVFNT